MINKDRYSTHGQLVLRGLPCAVRFELTGYPEPDLRGQRIEFDVPDNDREATPEDIRALAEHFLNKFSADGEVPLKHLTEAALQYLQKAVWAGNVRELQHALERAFILAGNDQRLKTDHFQPIGEGSVLREI